MAKPSVLQAETKLYSPMEPDGRVFQAGESWPGDAWSEKRGGEAQGANTAAAALKDLVAANAQSDQLSRQLASKDHDLAKMAAERDQANGKVADLEQRALAAEKAKGEADEAARNYMVERDNARAETAKARADLQAAEQLVEAANQEKAAVVEQLNAANQAIADLNGASAAKTTK